MNTLIPLLRQSIDYAGLFPPASLSLAETAKNYQLHLSSPAHMMLSRLVVPLGKLEELGQMVENQTIPISETVRQWRISLLLPPVLQSQDMDVLTQGIQRIGIFNDQFRQHRRQPMIVDCLEVKLNFQAITLADFAEMVKDFPCYIEIDWVENPEPSIAAISRQNGNADSQTSGSSRQSLHAKIRTGSVQADQIPTAAQVARFIASCTRHQVSFKATAGLHHPLRGEYRLTYQPDAPIGTMHGYLNVFVATMISLRYAVEQDLLVEILEERDGGKFCFDQNGLHWQGLTVEPEEVESLRDRGIHSFGSCSFDEPTTELIQQFENIFN